MIMISSDALTAAVFLIRLMQQKMKMILIMYNAELTGRGPES
jgi:hypothetical protein